MKLTLKKVLSFVLVLGVMLGSMPLQAFAEIKASGTAVPENLTETDFVGAWFNESEYAMFLFNDVWGSGKNGYFLSEPRIWKYVKETVDGETVHKIATFGINDSTNEEESYGNYIITVRTDSAGRNVLALYEESVSTPVYYYPQKQFAPAGICGSWYGKLPDSNGNLVDAQVNFANDNTVTIPRLDFSGTWFLSVNDWNERSSLETVIYDVSGNEYKRFSVVDRYPEDRTLTYVHNDNTIVLSTVSQGLPACQFNNGAHNWGGLVAADFDCTQGGYTQPHYVCMACGLVTDSEKTTSLVKSSATQSRHSFGTLTQVQSICNNTSGSIAVQKCQQADCKIMCDSLGREIVEIHGNHIVTLSLHPVDWVAGEGGFPYDYNVCVNCGHGFDRTKGIAHQYVDGYNDSNNDGTPDSGGSQPTPGATLQHSHIPNADTKAPASTDIVNNGGYTVENYECYSRHCNILGLRVDANGDVLAYTAPSGGNSGCTHTAGSTKITALFSCVEGGFASDYYLCQYCENPVDENGTEVAYIQGTHNSHTVGKWVGEADYDCTTGGYGEDYYECTNTGCEVYVNQIGDRLTFWPADPAGHNFNSQLNEAYVHCIDGGYDKPHYDCMNCMTSVDENGNVLSWVNGSGKHTPDEYKMPANWMACTGGITEEHYACTVCYDATRADGSEPINAPATENHSLGQLIEIGTFDPCKGGFDEDHYLCSKCNNGLMPIKDDVGQIVDWLYIAYFDARHTPDTSVIHPAKNSPCEDGYLSDWCECTLCGEACDPEGWFVEYETGLGHKPTGEVNEPDYIECVGGFTTEWYHCDNCGETIDKAGNIVTRQEGNGNHKLEFVQASETNIAHYSCTACYGLFGDENGKNELRPADVTIGVYVGTLEQDDISAELIQAFNPENDPDIDIIECIGQAMVEYFMADQKLTEEDLDKSDYGAELIDVAIKELLGTGVVGNAEIGPDGVDVLIPYPEGTDGNTFTFLIYHMNSLTGEIDTPEFKITEDGLLVHFDSLSPVLMVYKEVKNTPPAPSQQPAPPVHTHKWVLQRKTSATHHWYECSECGAKDEYAQHIYSSEEDTSCNVCFYVRKITVPQKPEPTPERTETPQPTAEPTQQAKPTPLPNGEPQQSAQGGIPVIPVAIGGIGILVVIMGLIVKGKKNKE